MTKHTVGMTDAEFAAKTGMAPVDDDLDRVNCDQAGEIGHWYCGWCHQHDMPRFQCGCRAVIKRATE